MTRLAILGAGGHGRVVADAAALSGRWQEIVFYDDRWPQSLHSGVWPIVGNALQLFCDRLDGELIVAIGDNRTRLEKSRELHLAGARLANVVHPRAVVSAHARFGAGVMVCAGAVVNVGAAVGDACIINSLAVIEHDCVLADGVHVSPGAALGGAVRVGLRSWVGIGACVRPLIDIGSDAIVGAGAVVVKPVADATVVVSPASAARP